MRRIEFHRARSLDEALAWKNRWGSEAALLAGGTDLIVGLREESPSLPALHVIDLGGLPLRAIVSGASSGGPDDPSRAAPAEETGSDERWIRIGALATHAAIESDARIRRSASLLAQACGEVGSPLIRNRGTIGGNIMNASSCADTLPPLLALGADLVLCSARGARTIGLDGALLAPYRTAAEPDEILTEIRFRALPEAAGSSFHKLGRRNALSISRMSIAAVVRTAGGSVGRDFEACDSGAGDVITEVRLAAGSVLPVPARFPEVERFLCGKPASSSLFEEAGRLVAGEMIRIAGRRWSTPYKEPVVAALVRRALEAAVPVASEVR